VTRSCVARDCELPGEGATNVEDGKPRSEHIGAVSSRRPSHVGWLRLSSSFISSHGEFSTESLELLCTTALDIVQLGRDDRFSQVRRLYRSR
jgi:hypothetical protein